VDDDLPTLSMGEFGPLAFASISPAHTFAGLMEPLCERLDFLPLCDLRFEPESSRDYVIDAHWGLYCDNYLEGFHIPYVHRSLLSSVDMHAYHTETFAYASLQLAECNENAQDPVFELPPSHPDFGKRVVAFYFFVFPATMINVYPWGVSVNVILPEGSKQTRIRYLTYVWDDRTEARQRGPGADLQRVEYEDEAVVERCQLGVQSPLYSRGRFSPRLERAVHHFHRCIAELLRT
jgi:choline monooxygenase